MADWHLEGTTPQAVQAIAAAAGRASNTDAVVPPGTLSLSLSLSLSCFCLCLNLSLSRCLSLSHSLSASVSLSYVPANAPLRAHASQSRRSSCTFPAARADHCRPRPPIQSPCSSPPSPWGSSRLASPWCLANSDLSFKSRASVHLYQFSSLMLLLTCECACLVARTLGLLSLPTAARQVSVPTLACNVFQEIYFILLMIE